MYSSSFDTPPPGAGLVAVITPEPPAKSAAVIVIRTRVALTNVARHAQASRIDVAVTVDGATVSLTIEDDGYGPPPPDTSSAGNGLRNLASRAERLGGHFELQRRRGGGARQVWSVPRPS